MSCCCDGAGFSPGEQFMGGDEALAQLQVFFAVVAHLFCQLLCMCEKKVDVRSARAAVSTAAVASRAARFSVLAPPSSRLPRASSTLVVLLACPIWCRPFHERTFFMPVVYGQWQRVSRVLQRCIRSACPPCNVSNQTTPSSTSSAPLTEYRRADNRSRRWGYPGGLSSGR